MKSSNVVSMLRARPKASDATVLLVQELCDLVVTSLRGRLDAMFDGADNLLFEFAERAHNNNDRRLFFDTMRAVRLGRGGLTARFCEAIAAGFVGVAPSAPLLKQISQRPYWRDESDELTLQKSESVELSIAVSNMATKADHLYKQLLWDISGRMAALVEDSQAPLSSAALSPMTLCTAFRSSAESLDVEFGVELVVFKLFDRLVISDLADLYASVLQFLKRHGVRSAQSSAAGHASAIAPEPAAPAPPSSTPAASTSRMHAVRPAPSRVFSTPLSGDPGLSAAVAQAITTAAVVPSVIVVPTRLDAHTLATLQQMSAAAPNALVYTNASLAADLAAAAQGHAVLGWGVRQSAAYVQRASLVGQMFNDILADPHVSPGLRTQFDGLRMATIKVALKDFAFVSDPDHPVRGLINELATMATTARAGGSEGLACIARLVDRIQEQFEIASETLRKPSVDIELVDSEQATRFIEHQQAQTNARRQAMVKRVRRIIAEELQLRCRGHVIGDDVRALLHSAWAPMMAMHLLHHGPESREWREGMNLLDRILNSLDPARIETRGRIVLQMLFDDIEAEFKAVDLSGERITTALDGYRRTLTAIDEAAPVEVSDVPEDDISLSAMVAGDKGVSELLEQLIVPGGWFLIFDPDRNESRWMKAVAYYAGLDCAAFAEYNGARTLLLKSRMLLDDLASRRTIPIDLGPSARASLDRFLARAA